MNRALLHLEEDQRLVPMLNGLSTAYVGQTYTGNKSDGSAITADMINDVRTFPIIRHRTPSLELRFIYLI